jgi:N6-L-threonylcarbamoyladenine synthase
VKDLILAIESSCDDTSAAVIADGRVLSNVIHTQVLHNKYGGVVPELASRAHQVKILPTIQEALQIANVSIHEIDAIAFTRGPGLLGALLVGVTTAKSLGYALDVPLIEVHHMHAHVLAHFINEPFPEFPFLCLTVSGGHTQIVLVKDPLNMMVIGKTIDDAAGEAFDKAGKMLGLDYPAGPEIDRLAQEGNAVFTFNKPRIADHDFSFSGLKTSILYFLRDQLKINPNFIDENLNDLCASIQNVIVEILITKLIHAARESGISQIAIAGGVSANSELRKVIHESGKKLGWTTYIPQFQYCTDNAAMIAMAAHFKWKKQIFSDQSVVPMARMPF